MVIYNWVNVIKEFFDMGPLQSMTLWENFVRGKCSTWVSACSSLQCVLPILYLILGKACNFHSGISQLLFVIFFIY